MENKQKPSFDTKRQVLGEIFPLATPFTVVLDSSEACNFRCSYCFRAEENLAAWGEYAPKKNRMSEEVFMRALGQIMGFPEQPKMISLSNHGEPLCNRKLPQMVQKIKEAGFWGRVSIHTNASLLDEGYATELGQSGIDKIVVSLQGLDAKTYKNVCGAEIDYDRFYNNLAVLYRNKSENTRIHIKIADVAVGDRKEEFLEKFSLIADTVFVENIVPIWKNVGNSVKPETMQNKFGTSFPYQECCPVIFDTLVVTPDGEVYPCTQLTSQEKLGNIFESDLCTLWNSETRRSLLRGQLTGQTPKSCNGCYIRQNSIFTKEDMIDDYREEILKRL